ncbi:PQQ-binding-like beta-propeller repeat protein, partial [Chromatium okenii]|uniref:outer membrane protein assembly factor BamB family protein n=1 Tax=Chromatium okenii TaxID=61644 RepID=UPI0026ECBCEC
TADDSLFITDSQDQVWSADLNTGAGRWKQDALRYRQLTAPTVLGDWLLVGDLEGYLHVLHQADGRLLGRTRITKDGITARPLLVDGRLYVYAKDGTLTALSVGAGSAPKSPQPPFVKGGLAAPAAKPNPAPAD